MEEVLEIQRFEGDFDREGEQVCQSVGVLHQRVYSLEPLFARYHVPVACILLLHRRRILHGHLVHTVTTGKEGLLSHGSLITSMCLEEGVNLSADELEI